VADDTFSARDIEHLLGIRERTLHFWRQSGLLEGPGAGRGSRYTDEHLGKLALIQKLRAEDKSLSDIRKALRDEPAATFRRLAARVKAASPKQEATAKDLIRHWLREPYQPPPAAEPRRSPGQDAPLALGRAADEKRREVWERLPLAPGVELHVQRPLPPRSRDLVDEIVAAARRLAPEHTR
jgi:DNA-binding transcriptional MerR regulator